MPHRSMSFLDVALDIISKAQQARPDSRGAEQKRGRDGRDKQVHLLPSGAQQRTVYIPPKDQRPKGRHQQRHKSERDKFQEGNTQRLMPRKQLAVSPSARSAPEALKSARLVEGSTVREFAEKIEAKPRDIVTALMQRGVMATINQTISPDMAKDIGRQYGFDVAFGDYEDMIVESEFEITPDAMEDTDPRAPGTPPCAARCDRRRAGRRSSRARARTSTSARTRAASGRASA